MAQRTQGTVSTPGSVLIVGGDSEIGHAVSALLRDRGAKVTTTTRHTETTGPGRVFLDLSQPGELWPRLPALETCLICAGETSTETCRRHPADTAAINVNATVRLVTDLVGRGVYALFLSSNQVFDGIKPNRLADDPLCPIIEYGRQKATAERRLLALGSGVGVLRLTKVLGPRPSRFLDWKRTLMEKRLVTAFYDMGIAPLSQDFVARLIARILETRVEGVLQASGDRDIPYSAIAEVLADRIGADRRLIYKTSSRIAGLSEPVPVHTTLDTRRIRDLLSVEVPTSMETLGAVLQEL